MKQLRTVRSDKKRGRRTARYSFWRLPILSGEVFFYHVHDNTENENKIIKKPGRICSSKKEGILSFLHEREEIHMRKFYTAEAVTEGHPDVSA